MTPPSPARTPPRTPGRSWALAGLVGPLGFITAWLAAGSLTDGYSPVGDAISRLAAVGAPYRTVMAAGFVCFGVAVPIYALVLRRCLGGQTWIAATTSGVATLGIALFPLGSSGAVDGIHNGLAALGYLALAATPVLAARALSDDGHRRAARASVAVGVLAGACLAATVAGPAHGLFQRTGLTVVDVWLMASAVWIARGRVRSAAAGEA